MDDYSFEHLPDGFYTVAGSYVENVRYTMAHTEKLTVRRVRLPDGRGNIIYLLSKDFESSVNMIRNGTFIMPPSYRRMYYPPLYSNTFMGWRLKFNVAREKATRASMVNQETKLRAVIGKKIPLTAENMIVSLGDIYQGIDGIVSHFPIRRNWTEFYPELKRLLDEMTPPAKAAFKDKNCNHRVLVIDAESFGFRENVKLKEQKTNPLFLLYLAFLRTRDLTSWNLDMDMMICSGNCFMKFNPIRMNRKVWSNFRRGLFKITNADLDAYLDRLDAEDKREVEAPATDRIVSNVVKTATEPYTKQVSPTTKAVINTAVERKMKQQARETLLVDQELKKAIGTELPKPKEPEKPLIMKTNPARPISPKQERLFKSVIAGYEQLLGKPTGFYVDDEYDDDRPMSDEEDEDVLDEFEQEVQDAATETLTQDKEVAEEILDEIQDQVAPMKSEKTAPVNSARDRKLREAQKKIVVKDSTIEQILERDANNVPLETKDVSGVMHTTNPNMQKITFANFDKTYLDQLYVKDLVSCFDMLKDKDSPFYITGIEIRDTSDAANFKETWSVHLTDENKKRHTIKVDIPKFMDDRFMFIENTKWIILKQNLYNPVVKDSPDTVIMTTNFNKVTIDRKATKSLSTVERIFSLIKKSGNEKMFVTGDSTRGNLKYISTLEYDELARRLFKFESGNCELWFSRDYIIQNLMDRIPPNYTQENEFFIGHEGDEPVVINEDTGLDRKGRTISQIIEENLPEADRVVFKSIKAPKQSMFAEAKMAGEMAPVIVILMVWVGLTESLKRMNIQWKFDPNARRVPKEATGKRYIRFADGLLEYEPKIYAELILNGLQKLHPEQFRFAEFDSEVGYAEYIHTLWGSYNGINELQTFYQFLIDPITKDVCKDMNLPDDSVGLLIHAVKLMSDNAFLSKSSDKMYRVRSIERIPAILYKCISDQYKSYVRSGHRIPMTLNQRCVIQRLLADKTVEAYSTLNPVVEVSKTHSISPKGYNGSNSTHAYRDEKKRSYDPSSVGKIAISTSAKQHWPIQTS